MSSDLRWMDGKAQCHLKARVVFYFTSHCQLNKGSCLQVTKQMAMSCEAIASVVRNAVQSTVLSPSLVTFTSPMPL